MQAGNVLAVGVAALVVAATRRFWLAALPPSPRALSPT
jgi:hypothetical protein